MMARAVVGVWLSASLVVAGQARAQRVDLATANALFDEGIQLNRAGHFAEACVRLEASMALAQRLGVQLRLADCYEHLGKLASAWVAFGEAIARAHRMVDPREAFARKRQAALVPRLPRLVIALPTSTLIDGLAVTRDGNALPSSAYDLEVPIDLGEHTIEVTAPGYIGWSTPISISAEGEVVTVSVPELQPVPRTPEPQRAPEPLQTPEPQQAPEPQRARDRSQAVMDDLTSAAGSRRVSRVTWIVAGTGVVSVGIGSLLGLSARSLSRQGRQGCDSSNACTPEATADIERSRRYGNFATVAFGVGAAALTTGLILYLRSPRGGGVRVAPMIAPGSLGVVIEGAR